MLAQLQLTHEFNYWNILLVDCISTVFYTLLSLLTEEFQSYNRNLSTKETFNCQTKKKSNHKNSVKTVTKVKTSVKKQIQYIYHYSNKNKLFPYISHDILLYPFHHKYNDNSI
ncbi:hypothetical protein MS3_00002735 [Schistosoma haematobium]|uniref:Uncharacterized protein n=1 Tax=Schistosoma haematobium TaxID=6185 RepID=A0A922LMF5_SCHHA|nr:hypothetical protein MS3_00002735 [Schistosoma haematobium]KAH9589801.1 hypothetical protein MS3_00002735 [Schistosoma haematobium]